jgi:dipeptidyl aminopeptidase/acylaminoacyl peptidase
MSKLKSAAEAMVRAHWTDADHLGIPGGSNGGLLMGAELTQHPEAFRAVVSLVGNLRHAAARAVPQRAIQYQRIRHGVTASFSQHVGNMAAALTFFAHEPGLGIR